MRLDVVWCLRSQQCQRQGSIIEIGALSGNRQGVPQRNDRPPYKCGQQFWRHIRRLTCLQRGGQSAATLEDNRSATVGDRMCCGTDLIRSVPGLPDVR